MMRGAVPKGHRVKMINHLKEAGAGGFDGFLHLLFLVADELFDFDRFLADGVEPVDAGNIGGVIELERGFIAEPAGQGKSMG